MVILHFVLNWKIKGSGGKETAKSWAGAESGCGWAGMRNATQRDSVATSILNQATKNLKIKSLQKNENAEEKVASIWKSERPLLI